jgi:hypothetical protein
MAAKYTRLNQDDTRIHQEIIDIIESGRDNKNTKATKCNLHNKHTMYAVVDPALARTIPQKRRMPKFIQQHTLHTKPMSTHHFGKLTAYDGLGNINHMKVRKLFKIKNLAGYPAHRISDERIAWICGWIFGKQCEHIDDETVQQNAFTFLREMWASPTFCTFFSPEESMEFLRRDGVLWVFRLSTTFPHTIRITKKNSNDEINSERSLNIHQKRTQTSGFYWWELWEFRTHRSPTAPGPN